MNARCYVRERSPGKFELRAYLGVDARGKPKYRQETHHGDKRSADTRARELELMLLRGELGQLSSDSLSATAERYIARLETMGDLELSTIKGYRDQFKRLTPKLGGTPIGKLAARDFELFYEYLLTRKRRPLAPVTVGNVHRFFALVMKDAVGKGELERSPLDGVKPPKADKKRREVDFNSLFDDDDAEEIEGNAIPVAICRKVIQSYETGPIRAALDFAYRTGTRRGEFLALTWRDLHLTGNAPSARIRRAMWWPYGVEKPVVKTPKTEAGRRVVRLSSKAVDALHEWRQHAEQIARAAGRKLPALVFFDIETFGPLRPDKVSATFNRKIKSLGYNGKLHGLRHTHASALLSAGEPVHLVSRRLGHGDVATTLRIYAHAIPGSDESVASRVDDLL